MHQPDQPPPIQVDQSQQGGGVSLGAYNEIQQLEIGDVVAGDKLTIQTFQLIVYTGPERPVDPLARRDLELAYRSEVALRYAVWKTRYATLPMQTSVQPGSGEAAPPFLEPDEFHFQTLGSRAEEISRPDQSPGDEEAAAPIIDTFSDLREGLKRYHDMLLLAPPGGGKTTALWRLALDLAHDGMADPTRPLPVFVRLGGLGKGDTLDGLLRRELARATLYDARKRPILLPAHRQMAALLPDLLALGRVVLLWDGLNETPTELFAATAGALVQFRDKYPPTIHSRNMSVVTCRSEDFAALCEAHGGESPLLSSFWVARLPITVAQSARFVQAGYREDRYWTPHGLEWRGERTTPHLWGNPNYSDANQPVVYVTWYEATAFCRWLSEQLRDVLDGLVLRLPTEAEWEVAAAYAGATIRHPYPWGAEEPTPERAVYHAWQLRIPAPVGLCPAGAAACGALDLVGNVWEWCASAYRAYPDGASTLEKDFTSDKYDTPVRGGAYLSDRTYVQCLVRDRDHLGDWFGHSDGFRVVAAPPLSS